VRWEERLPLFHILTTVEFLGTYVQSSGPHHLHGHVYRIGLGTTATTEGLGTGTSSMRSSANVAIPCLCIAEPGKRYRLGNETGDAGRLGPQSRHISYKNSNW